MKMILTMVIGGLIAFGAGALSVVGALAVSAVSMAQGAFAFGGAFDPITASLAVGLGGVALSRLRSRTPEVTGEAA